MTTSDTVLVTGGTGYLETRLIADLLLAGSPVITTARALDRSETVRDAVRRSGADDANLSLAVASLTSDGGWAAAATDVSVVYHLASPMIQSQDPNEVPRGTAPSERCEPQFARVFYTSR